MKYAIDRYNNGTEKEVSADEFDGLRYIAGRRNRFYCPECGELVYFRAKGGSQPNQFFHQEKTDGSPECDRRVDGRSSLSLCERVGLPIYLTTLVPGSFQISIGFPAIGAEMLEKATLANYKVEISFEDNCRTIKVNSVNFVEDETSLIPVNFIPPNGKNYTITISGERTVFGLQRKWSNYADGFEPSGAIFTCEESYGKKVRRKDSISTHKRYYVVTKKTLPNYPSLVQTRVGTMNVGRESFNVYIVEINVSIDDEAAFSTISSFFYKNFKVWLLEHSPELVPIWPPVIQHDFFVPVSGLTNVVCAVSSGNVSPNVFVYSDYGVSNKEINHDYNGVKTVDIVLGKRAITLSVDRKYAGREVSFLSKQIPDSTFHYDIGIRTGQNNTSLNNICEKDLSSEFAFLSNSKMELYAGTKGKLYRHIPIRESTTIVNAIKSTVELFLVVESAVIHHVHCRDDRQKSIEHDDLLPQLKEARSSQMVPIPRWADYVIRSLKNSRNTLFDIVMSTIANGKMPIGVLQLLRTIELERANKHVMDKQDRENTI